MEYIFNKASEISWSDTYCFVRDPKEVKGDEILITSQGLQRALKRLCDKANIHYLPPHQVRFSEAALLAIEGADLQTIQFHMGHIGPDMSLYYMRGAQKELPTAGPKLA